MIEDKVKSAAEQIIEEIDKLTLLGAAFDCMSEAGKASLQKRIEKIIQGVA